MNFLKTIKDAWLDWRDPVEIRYIATSTYSDELNASICHALKVGVYDEKIVLDYWVEYVKEKPESWMVYGFTARKSKVLDVFNLVVMRRPVELGPHLFLTNTVPQFS